jgi:hypothetical protein
MPKTLKSKKVMPSKGKKEIRVMAKGVVVD